MTKEILSKRFTISLISVMLLVLSVSLLSSPVVLAEDDNLSDDDRLTIKGRLVIEEEPVLDEISEKFDLNLSERKSLKKVLELVDSSEFDDDELKDMIRRQLIFDDSNPEDVYEFAATDVEVLTRWIEKLELKGEEVRALRKVAIIMDIEGMDEERIRTLISRQVSVDNDSDAYTSTKDVDDSDKLAESYNKIEEHRQDRMENLRQDDPDAVRILEDIFEDRADDEAVLDLLDDATIIAITKSGAADDILGLPARILQRYSEEDFHDPEIRAELVERARRMRQVMEGDSAEENLSVDSQDSIEKHTKEDAEAFGRVKDARENVRKKSGQMRRTRESFKEIQEQIRTCIRDPEQDCSSATMASRAHIMSTLEYLESKIDAKMAELGTSGHLSGRQQNETISSLTAVLGEIQDQKERLIDADSFTEIRELGNKTDEISKRVKDEIRYVHAEKSSDALEDIVARTSLSMVRIDVMISELKGTDINVTELDATVDEFSAHVEEANRLRKEIDDLVSRNFTGSSEARDIDDIEELMEKARAHAQSARDILKDVLESVHEMADELDITYAELMRMPDRHS